MSSLQHILHDPGEAGTATTTTPARPAPVPVPVPTMPTPASLPPPPPPNDQLDDQTTPAGTPKDEYTSTTASTRRNASGNVSSVYSGNKVRHLKKEDGIPLWRKDIQYDFLRLVFSDRTKCFTKASDGSKGYTFAEVYIDAMAKSSKTSKILKEKLLQDQEGAVCMAMVCLLVNVGRMNTTLNFFPEMRAQLRTYHSIPALQAHQDPTAYKQLQDAPRLKSILKGATEDEPQPNTLEEIREATIPRTNAVNLIFVMSQYALKISEKHFAPPRDFFDLVMRPTLTSISRTRAFLWLIWWYLESDFGYEDSQRNPFGKGEFMPGEDGMPVRVPELEVMTDAQAALENVDTDVEMHFGEVKRKERIAILASEPSPAMTALKRARKEKGLTTGHGAQPSDDEGGSEVGYWKDPRGQVTSAGRSLENASEYTRSPSPLAAGRGFNAVNAPTPAKQPGDMRIHDLLNKDEAEDLSTLSAPPPAPPVKKGPGRGNWRRNKPKTETFALNRGGDTHGHIPLLPNTGQISIISEGPSNQLQPATPGGSNYQYGGTQMSPPTTISFQPPNTRDHVPTPSYQAQKRHRGVTTHQSALASHRKQQVDYTLDRRIRKLHAVARERREAEGPILRAWKRIRTMPRDYDSEEEQIKIRKAKERNEKGDDDWRAVHKGKEHAEFLSDLESIRRPKMLLAGLAPAAGEVSDIGEEPRHMAKVIRRASRRLERWQESTTPGMAMIRRRQIQVQGTLPTTRRVLSSHRFSTDHDGTDVDEDQPGTRRPQRQRSSNGRAGDRRVSSGIQHHQRRAEVDPDDDDGGGELDEEDRELLGEVDADESEDEDEDEDEDELMGDD